MKRLLLKTLRRMEHFSWNEILTTATDRSTAERCLLVVEDKNRWNAILPWLVLARPCFIYSAATWTEIELSYRLKCHVLVLATYAGCKKRKLLHYLSKICFPTIMRMFTFLLVLITLLVCRLQWVGAQVMDSKPPTAFHENFTTNARFDWRDFVKRQFFLRTKINKISKACCQ